jgi:hypothetical protein
MHLSRPVADDSRGPAARGGAAPRPRWPIWLVVGLAGWAGVAALGARLYASVPPRAGFDLELLLGAGRRVAAGQSPYDPAVLAGAPPAAVDLFYSYPPPVAQYLSLFASVPSAVMLVAWGVTAAAGLVAAAVVLGRLARGPEPASAAWAIGTVGVPVAAVVPFVFPFAVAIIFGNLDALFPLLYGLMLVGALAPSLAARFAGGAALAIAAVAKLHPASMGLWFLVRGFRDRRPAQPGTTGSQVLDGPRGVSGAWLVAGAAAAVLAVIGIVSLAVGGASPWMDYATVVRAAAAASLVDARNVGPASQLALVTGGDDAAARTVQFAFTGIAIVGTAVAAWFLDDTVESFGWAAVASLVILPVTWFHYPVALIPLGIVAWVRCDGHRRRSVAGALAGALAVGVVAVGIPVGIWSAVLLVMLAVRFSRPTSVETTGILPVAVPVPAASGRPLNS